MRKRVLVAIFAALAGLPMSAQAFVVLPVGNIPRVEEEQSTLWGLSGAGLFHVRTGHYDETPIMRTLRWDARLVEILTRTQDSPLRPDDIRIATAQGGVYIVLRNYLLLEVTLGDALEAGVSRRALAQHWAARLRAVLPAVIPMVNRRGA